MSVEEDFVSMAALICEPVRARMLWNLMDGRAYTATELAMLSDGSPTATSNHLAKLLKSKIVKVDVQGRHRYYSLATPEIAYSLEGLASISGDRDKTKSLEPERKGIHYCRTCYDHLAGYVAVEMTETMEKNQYLKKSGTIYEVTKRGWDWFSQLNISKNDFMTSRRPLTRQCLDWSERRPHLAGLLGAVLLSRMLERKWFRKIPHSREMIVTVTGRKELEKLLLYGS